MYQYLLFLPLLGLVLLGYFAVRRMTRFWEENRKEEEEEITGKPPHAVLPEEAEKTTLREKLHRRGEAHAGRHEHRPS